MRHHEHERRVSDRLEERAPERQPPIHEMLALQRSAGNQAVSAMLARQPVAEEATGGSKQQDAAGTVTLTKIGVIPILSFSMGAEQGRPHEQRDYTFTSKVGTHSTKLMEAMVKGEMVDAEIEIKGRKIKLSKAYVSSYRTSESEGEQIEQWTLTPEVARIDDGSGGGGGGGGSPDWDSPG